MPGAFDAARPHLRELPARPDRRPKKESWWLVGALAFGGAGAGRVGALFTGRNSRWGAISDAAKQSAGLVVRGRRRSWGDITGSGGCATRCPGSAPTGCQSGIPAASLEARFMPYQSLDEHFQRERDFRRGEAPGWNSRWYCFPVNSSVAAPTRSIRIDNIEESLKQDAGDGDKLGHQTKVVLSGRADHTGARNQEHRPQRATGPHVYGCASRTRHSLGHDQRR